jgi:hypothetical protein
MDTIYSFRVVSTKPGQGQFRQFIDSRGGRNDVPVSVAFDDITHGLGGLLELPHPVACRESVTRDFFGGSMSRALDDFGVPVCQGEHFVRAAA